MTPEEGEAVQVDTALHSEFLQFPEESLTEVKSHLSPENFVAQQDPETGDVRTVPGDVDNLRAVPLLLVTLHREPLQPRPRHRQ